jgi:5-methylthioadenosine/S-adenosylhomocysteine deaminase
MQTLIRNGIAFWPPDHMVRPIHILIEGDTIQQVSESQIQARPEMQVYDVRGHLVVPGFVDAHTHLTQSFGRGIYDNRHVTQWLQALQRHFTLTPEEIYTATLLGCLEAIQSGTTTVAEMTTVRTPGETAIRAVADSGLRAVIGSCLGDVQEGDNPPPEMNAQQVLHEMRGLHRRWHGECAGRITMRVSPVGLPACSEELMRGSRSLADELGVGIHTHCCEGETETAGAYARFGCSEVEALQRFGVLGPDAQLVHCVWLTERDKDLIAATGSSAVHCPSTNCKITDGLPPMPDLLRRGVNIALGCDGAASSGTYDLLKEARLAALLNKGISGDASVFNAHEILDMLTCNGARAVGLQGQVGVLDAGHKADMTVIEYPQPHLIDERRLLSNLIYGGAGSDVESVFVGGRPLMWQRQVLHLDAERITAQALEMLRSAHRILPD